MKSNYVVYTSIIILCMAGIIYGANVQFTPLGPETWVQLNMGKLVIFSSIAVMVLFPLKLFFPALACSVFNLFFLLHEIIVSYDSKAVELGKETAEEVGAHGVFMRSVVDIYLDSFKAPGAKIVFIFGCAACLVIIVSWIIQTYKDNKAIASKHDALRSQETTLGEEESVESNKDVGSNLGYNSGKYK